MDTTQKQTKSGKKVSKKARSAAVKAAVKLEAAQLKAAATAEALAAAEAQEQREAQQAAISEIPPAPETVAPATGLPREAPLPTTQAQLLMETPAPRPLITDEARVPFSHPLRDLGLATRVIATSPLGGSIPSASRTEPDSIEEVLEQDDEDYGDIEDIEGMTAGERERERKREQRKRSEKERQ